MKNHFVFGYMGNKREEVEIIYKHINDKINLNEIDTIIEPYCGSCSISYYISTKHPKKFKYILNDNNNLLIGLLEILKDEDKLKKFLDELNKILFKNGSFISKEEYKKLGTKQHYQNIHHYFILHKIYNFRIGVYPENKKDKIKPFDLATFTKKYPIINFLRTENIILKSEDALNLIIKENKKENLIIADPPYIMTECNLYVNPNGNIYEYLTKNSAKVENLIIILEYNWIIKLLLKDMDIFLYEKKYTGFKKKTVQHVIGWFKK